ncbi:MAG: TRAP transporter substrate-binding protein [Alphaproteobacteria bacterium]
MDRRSFMKGAGLAAASTALVTPAIAQERVSITMVATWGRDFPGLGTGAQRFAASLSEVSDGRIQVEYFAANERVAAFDSFDEVASGNAQAYHGAEYYWKGKHPGFAYFTAVPFGFTNLELNAWIRYGGGQELWDKLAAEFGTKAMMCGNTGVQAGGWFNKEINSGEDLKGLKFRMPGLGGDVLGKVGASPVSLPGGQIYENLVSGAIDGCEWVGPWNDEAMKFHEAAKYYYLAGMHEPGGSLATGFNLDFWNSLTNSDRAMIEHCAAAANDIIAAEFNAKNGDALARLINDHGVQLREFNDDVWDTLAEGAIAVREDVRAHSPLAKEIDESFAKGIRDIGKWYADSNAGYVRQRQRIFGEG